MSDREKALEQLMQQIEIVKSFAKDVDESQGLIANAITTLTVGQLCQAILQTIQTIDQKLTVLLENKTPTIYTP